MNNLHWICSVPIGTTICVLGILGNILSILVWRRIVKKTSRGNSSTGIYLLSLGIVDSGFLVMFLLADSLPTAIPSLKSVYAYAFFYCYIGYPMFFYFIVFSIWLILTITINRFLMVSFPTRVNQWYSNRNTLISITVVGVLAFMVNIPHFFSYYPEANPSDNMNSIKATDFGKSDSGYAYEFWIHCIFLVLAPWFAIATLNSVIIYKLHAQAKKFDSKKGFEKAAKERHERQMTITLLVVTFSFLILLAWQCITQCFWMLGYGRHHHDSSKWKLVDDSFAFAKLGLVINCSINCVLYCFSGTVFRKELSSLFRPKRSSFYSSRQSSTRPTRSSTQVLVNDSVM